MKRFIKWLVILSFVGVLVGSGSFAGASFAAGQFLGPRPPVEGRSTEFAYRGVDGLPGQPRAWVFTYSRVRLRGVRQVEIVVSPGGRVLSTRPRDLEQRLEAYRRSLEP